MMLVILRLPFYWWGVGVEVAVGVGLGGCGVGVGVGGLGVGVVPGCGLGVAVVPGWGVAVVPGLGVVVVPGLGVAVGDVPVGVFPCPAGCVGALELFDAAFAVRLAGLWLVSSQEPKTSPPTASNAAKRVRMTAVCRVLGTALGASLGVKATPPAGARPPEAMVTSSCGTAMQLNT